MPDKLVSMKLAPEKNRAYGEPVSIERPAYPYGLMLRLETEQLEALGIKDDLPVVGEKLMVLARVEVTSVSEHEDQGGGYRCDVSLQVTDLALEPNKGDGKKAAAKLYKEAY